MKVRQWLVLLFVMSLLARIAIRDGYYDFTFEPDSPACIKEVDVFYTFFDGILNCEIRIQPMTVVPTYFDGPFIVYALVARSLEAVPCCGFLKSRRARIIFAMRNTNIVLIALTVVFVFMSMHTVGAPVNLSGFVCLFYLVTNSQSVFVDHIRIDHFIAFSLSMQLFFALRILKEGGTHSRDWFLLGSASALILSTKITSLQYLVVPGMAVVLSPNSSDKWKKLVSGFVLVLAVVFFRWIGYWDKAPGVLEEIVQQGERWASYWSRKPYFYYHLAGFYQSTIVGLVSRELGEKVQGFWLGMVTAGFTATFLGITTLAGIMTLFKFRQNRMNWLFYASFAAISLVGIWSPKVIRYGICFPVLYSLGLAIFVSGLEGGRLRRAVIPAIYVGLFLILVFNLVNLENKVAYVKNASLSIQETRIKPRLWLLENSIAGDRLCYFKPHVAANPPVFDLQLDFSPDFLKAPYTSPKSCIEFLPPTRQEITNGTEFLMLENEHFKAHQKDLFIGAAITDRSWQEAFQQGPPITNETEGVKRTLEKLWLVDEKDEESHRAYKDYILQLPVEYRLYAWQWFYEYLPRYFKEVRFGASAPNYGIFWVKIYKIDT